MYKLNKKFFSTLVAENLSEITGKSITQFSLDENTHVRIDWTMLEQDLEVIALDKMIDEDGQASLTDIISLIQARVDRLFHLDDDKSPITTEQNRALRMVPDYACGSGSWPVKDVLDGVSFILGGTASGKTEHIASKTDDLHVLVRFGEPSEFIEHEHKVYASSIVEVIYTMLIAPSFGLHIAVDSFRPLMIGLRGAAGIQGSKPWTYLMATNINNLMAMIESHVMIAINPMVAISDISSIFEHFSASAAGAVHLADGQTVDLTYRLKDGRIKGSSGTVQIPNNDVVPKPSAEISKHLDIDDEVNRSMQAFHENAVGTGTTAIERNDQQKPNVTQINL